MNTNVVSLKEHVLIQEFELEPVAGAQILGYLDNEQKLLFIEINELSDHLYDFGKDMAAKYFERAAAITRYSEDAPEFAESLIEEHQLTQEDAEVYFELQTRYQYKSIMFWYNLRKQLQTFATFLSIRSGYAVCVVGNKYDDGG